MKERARLKRRTLLCLLLLAAIPKIFAEQKRQSKTDFAAEFGIDLKRTYSGTEVAELLEITVEEAESAIEDAFNEGYKKAMVEYAPEADFWKLKAERYEKEIKRLKRQRWLFCVGGFACGFVSGTGIGIRIDMNGGS